MKLLRIDSSARASSVTRQLTAEFVAAWKKENPGGLVRERDLSVTSLPLITDEWATGAHSDPNNLTPGQKQALSVSDVLVDELIAADVIVIGAPMYNFTISAPLKAWIDHAVRFGKTFAFDANGPRGLLTGKKVVVITSRGGAYRPGTFTAQFDFQEPYLRHVLGFMGLKDVTFIHAENQNKGELGVASRAAALENIGRVVGPVGVRV
jgi:FMN-dependent NADH-azoreductase